MSCPADATGRESAALSPTATGIVFAMRLLLVCAGVHIGESFAPIALTGGIACGKSTVARLLTNGGKAEDPNSTSVIHDGSVYLVDTDTIAHEILLPNTPDSVYKQVVEIFGPENILQDNDDDDTDSFLMNEDSPTHIDRRKLGDIIFQNPSKRRQLNSITHPRIILVMLKRMMYGLYWGNKDLVVVDVPLLYESGAFLRRLFCMTILVGCSSETQLDRLQSRNPDLTKQQCQQRIASQMDISQKAKLADIVIWNDSTYEELETQVENTRQAIMNNIYGVGLSLLQLLIIIGGSVPLAVLSKLYTLRANTTQE
jgi:dephospho-CoA kinase